MIDSSVALALTRAADLVEEHWRQFSMRDNDGNFCTSGAIELFTDGFGWFQVVSQAGKAVPECEHPKTLSDERRSLVHWNDFHCTSGAEAAALLRRAAELP